MKINNNNLGEFENKLHQISPEIRDLFIKYSGALVNLGAELIKRDNMLRLKRSNNGVN